MPRDKDEDPPHAKIAGDVVSCIFLVCNLECNPYFFIFMVIFMAPFLISAKFDKFKLMKDTFCAESQQEIGHEVSHSGCC